MRVIKHKTARLILEALIFWVGKRQKTKGQSRRAVSTGVDLRLTPRAKVRSRKCSFRTAKKESVFRSQNPLQVVQKLPLIN